VQQQNRLPLALVEHSQLDSIPGDTPHRASVLPPGTCPPCSPHATSTSEVHIPGANLASGHYTGHDELLGFFKKLHELSGGTIKVTANEIFDNGGGTVLATVTITAERNGRQVRFDAIQNWRFADGKATSLDYYLADQSVPDGFWV
jgi:ketosteroid isomerase-like protein